MLKTIKELTQVLEEILIPEGFCKKGNAFFKVLTENILCCVQFRKEGMFSDESSFPHPHYTLGLGLESLYLSLIHI